MRRWAALVGGLAGAAACSAPAGPTAGRCAPTPAAGGAAAATGAALTAASAGASFLGLSDRESNAVVGIVVGRGDIDRRLCTGVVVAPQWVLTAKHCVDPARAAETTVAVGPDAWCPARGAALARIDLNDDLDLALLLLTAPLPPALVHPLRPLAPADPLAAAVGQAGTLVQLAGDGVGPDGETGRRAFAVATVAGAADAWIDVTGDTIGGACFGDSGGPLMMRGASGAPLVAGILSAGAPTCHGVDRFVDLRGVEPWLAAHLGPAPADDTAPDCGTVDGEGRCFGALSVRCESGRLVAQRCTEGDICAWTPDGRFGCTSDPAGACGSISQAGVCVGDEAHVCDHGVLRTTACAATRCARLPESGTVGCAPPG